ncbi:hypothetical protein CV093_10675 [Oceanobacillus sp. 143]|nr:hypothetical protein [Oceanobacillus zhaokaii]QGS68768.1 hypothetical protein CV093_10675 [Oceanobacillus sp. 143]
MGGPFIAKTEPGIREAFQDFQDNKFGPPAVRE